MVPSTSGGASAEGRLPDDVVADLLASDRRRRALEVLSRRETAMSVADLAAAVRARELDTVPDGVDRDDRSHVREEFFQRHLPKLTATDVVRYDSVLGTVELADRESFGDVLDEP